MVLEVRCSAAITGLCLSELEALFKSHSQNQLHVLNTLKPICHGFCWLPCRFLAHLFTDSKKRASHLPRLPTLQMPVFSQLANWFLPIPPALKRPNPTYLLCNRVNAFLIQKKEFRICLYKTTSINKTCSQLNKNGTTCTTLLYLHCLLQVQNLKLIQNLRSPKPGWMGKSHTILKAGRGIPRLYFGDKLGAPAGQGEHYSTPKVRKVICLILLPAPMVTRDLP